MIFSRQILPSLLVMAFTLVTPNSGDDSSALPCFIPKTYFDIRLPNTQVPDRLTTYVCHIQNIPLFMPYDYQAVAFLPLISNPEVMHHMLLFGCPDTVSRDQMPHECSDADGACRNFLVQWSKGINGTICSAPNTGVSFGRNSIKSLSLQIHWNNERLANNMTDYSGVRIYYVMKRRRYDMGNVQIGQNDLQIPPKQVSVLQSGSCSSECTREWLDHPIYLTRAHIHMHYLGNGGSMHLIRKGKTVMTILEDKTFDYNSPAAHNFVKPIQILPGDEIKVTCNFNSKDGIRSRDKTVVWGAGSDGEMCYAFVSYYPKIEGFDQCVQYDETDICDRVEGQGAAIGNCVFPGFIHIFESGLAGEVIRLCKDKATALGSILSLFSASYTKLCTPQCLAAIREVTGHPCMQARLEVMAREKYLPRAQQWEEVKKIIEQNAARC